MSTGFCLLLDLRHIAFFFQGFTYFLIKFMWVLMIFFFYEKSVILGSVGYIRLMIVAISSGQRTYTKIQMMGSSGFCLNWSLFSALPILPTSTVWFSLWFDSFSFIEQNTCICWLLQVISFLWHNSLFRTNIRHMALGRFKGIKALNCSRVCNFITILEIVMKLQMMMWPQLRLQRPQNRWHCGLK